MTKAVQPGPHEVRWTWQSKDTDTRVGRMTMDKHVSVAALLAHMAVVAPGVSPEDILVNWATVEWTRQATEEELAERRAADQHWHERHERWERETLARLQQKYGPQ